MSFSLCCLPYAVIQACNRRRVKSRNHCAGTEGLHDWVCESGADGFKLRLQFSWRSAFGLCPALCTINHVRQLCTRKEEDRRWNFICGHFQLQQAVALGPNRPCLLNHPPCPLHDPVGHRNAPTKFNWCRQQILHVKLCRLYNMVNREVEHQHFNCFSFYHIFLVLACIFFLY